MLDQTLLDNFSKYFSLGKKAPCFLFEKEILVKKASEYQRAVKKFCPNVTPYYAIKSNNYQGILKNLVNLGFGLDASSGEELILAKKAEAKKVIFTGPGKSKEDLAYAIGNFDDVTIHLDSFGELEKLKQMKPKTKVNICARVNTGHKDEWNKFGIPLDQLKSFVNKVKKEKYVNFCGIHFHNSWNYSAEKYVQTLELILKYIQENFSQSEKAMFKVIDIGGGLFQDNLEAELIYRQKKSQDALADIKGHRILPAQSILDFFKILGSFYNEKLKTILPEVQLFTEPGRWLASHCFHILLKVADVKNDQLVILDGGTENFGFDNCKKYYYPIVNLSSPSEKEKKLILAGSLCSNYDIWGYFCYAKKFEIGDLLLIPFQGAYTYSMKKDFIREIPGVIEL